MWWFMAQAGWEVIACLAIGGVCWLLNKGE